MKRKLKLQIWERLEELQSDGDISLKLLPPPESHLICKSGNVLEVYLNEEKIEQYSDVSEQYFDELRQVFDTDVLKHAEL